MAVKRNKWSKKICKHHRDHGHCKKCDPLGWAKVRLSKQQYVARKGGYKPPSITAEELLLMSMTAAICIMCKHAFTDDNPNLHHDHKTGEVYGYAHSYCNIIEGLLKELTLAQQVCFLQTQFPEVVKVLRK